MTLLAVIAGILRMILITLFVFFLLVWLLYELDKRDAIKKLKEEMREDFDAT